jgi:glycerophosphoryl diester phosphodiesterase
MNHPLLLGHRGARARKAIPENTVASFDQALADGCDGFEFDVRAMADGDAVICHDPIHGKVEIARATARELKELPRLHDVLARYQDRAFLDIELKVAGLEKITLELLGKYPPRAGFVVSSFLPEVLNSLRALDSTIPLGLICDDKAGLQSWGRTPVEYVIPQHTLVDLELIRLVKAAGKKVMVWTVNSAAEMRRFVEYGVDGTISDDTSLLCRTLGK